ncbi:MAG: hypothetical protein ACJ8J7_16630 [Sulfurifustaceae bacterium]
MREASAATRVSSILERFRPHRVIPPEEPKHELRMLVYDGAGAQVMATLRGGPFLVAFALQLGASPLLIGALQPLTQILQFRRSNSWSVSALAGCSSSVRLPYRASSADFLRRFPARCPNITGCRRSSCRVALLRFRQLSGVAWTLGYAI